MRTLRLSAAAVVLFGGVWGFGGSAYAAQGSAVANLIQDPGFETPVLPTGALAQNYSTGQSIGPWNVVGVSGNVTVLSTSFTQFGFTFDAEEGVQWLDLTGLSSNAATGVAQTVPTVIGTTYELGFSVGNIVDPGGAFGTTSTVDVSVNGTKILGATNTEGTGQTKQVWKQFTVQFKATKSTSTLQFINGDPITDNSNGLDAITLTKVAGPPIPTSATLTSSTASPIALGSQTHDTATLAGGTSPTGSLVYKLFGPNDSTCSKVPAHISPTTTVKGDGTYMSPSFTPTDPGTYRWVDLYSGDSNNTPVTTACSDPSETVTVGSSPNCSPTVKHVFVVGNPRQEIVRVLIFGTCLQGATSVHFGGTPAASFAVTSKTSIQADPPLHRAGKVDVTVTTGGGTSPPNPPNDQYLYFRPQILQVLPDSGPTAGRSGVVIRGVGLSGATSVTFGRTPASFTIGGDGQIIAVTPKHAKGTVVVSVTNFAGTSRRISPPHKYTFKG